VFLDYTPKRQKVHLLHFTESLKIMSKITVETKQYILDLVRENYPKFNTEFNSLHGKQYVDSYLQLLKFIMPIQKTNHQTIESQNEMESIW
jgi:hypothetical protein